MIFFSQGIFFSSMLTYTNGVSPHLFHLFSSGLLCPNPLIFHHFLDLWVHPAKRHPAEIQILKVDVARLNDEPGTETCHNKNI